MHIPYFTFSPHGIQSIDKNLEIRVISLGMRLASVYKVRSDVLRAAGSRSVVGLVHQYELTLRLECVRNGAVSAICNGLEVTNM